MRSGHTPRAGLAALAACLFLSACTEGGQSVTEPDPGGSASDPVALDTPLPEDPEGGARAAIVNGEAVPLSTFQNQAFATMSHFVDRGLNPQTEEGQAQLHALRRQVLDDIINQVLIEQYSRELGLTVSDADLDARMAEYVTGLGGDAAFAQYLDEAETNLEAVREMERRNMIGQLALDSIAGDVATTGPAVRARHILCESRADCEDVVARLTSGEDFAAVASAVSKDELTAANGGDLDWIGQGTMLSYQLEAALFALAPGSVSGVIESEFGFHVAQVMERDEARELTAEQIYGLRERRLLAWLAERRAASAIEILIEDLQPGAAPTPVN